MKETSTAPSVGRILHAHSPNWIGPRPAVVVGQDSAKSCSAVVLLNGHLDTDAVHKTRSNQVGSTIADVTVYDVEKGDPEINEAVMTKLGTKTEQFGPVLLTWPAKV